MKKRGDLGDVKEKKALEFSKIWDEGKRAEEKERETQIESLEEKKKIKPLPRTAGFWKDNWQCSKPTHMLSRVE